eukprot:8527828-Pyramimonas_sp.AAC.1
MRRDGRDMHRCGYGGTGLYEEGRGRDTRRDGRCRIRVIMMTQERDGTIERGAIHPAAFPIRMPRSLVRPLTQYLYSCPMLYTSILHIALHSSSVPAHAAHPHERTLPFLYRQTEISNNSRVASKQLFAASELVARLRPP